MTEVLTEVLAQIPSIEDHAEYQACADKVAALEARLTEAKNELVSLGERGPIPSAEDADDLDEAITAPSEGCRGA